MMERARETVATEALLRFSRQQGQIGDVLGPLQLWLSALGAAQHEAQRTKTK